MNCQKCSPNAEHPATHDVTFKNSKGDIIRRKVCRREMNILTDYTDILSVVSL